MDWKTSVLDTRWDLKVHPGTMKIACLIYFGDWLMILIMSSGHAIYSPFQSLPTDRIFPRSSLCTLLRLKNRGVKMQNNFAVDHGMTPNGHGCGTCLHRL